MKKIKILSGSAFTIFLLVFYLCGEVGCFLLCLLTNVEPILSCMLLGLWSVMLALVLLLTNRTTTIVTYDPKTKMVTRRGLFWGFRSELQIADLVRVEVQTIPKEREYILLIDRREEHSLDSMSAKMPIRVPNTPKGRAFVSNFYAYLGN